MLKALIIGSNGQDGYYLKRLLLSKAIKVICLSRKNADYNGDVADFKFITNIIEKIKPDYIFHFAAESTTSHTALFDNHHSISTGTYNILEGMRLFSPSSKLFLSGSAMQFKNKGLPINEATEFDPSSSYSVSRIHSVMAGRYFRYKFGLKVYVGYLFNHDSPLRSEKHINQKITTAIKSIAAGSPEKIIIGDINVKKEFNYAGDIVKAIWILVNQDNIFEAVIGSGKTYSIKNWLEYCFNTINKNWKDYVLINSKYESEYHSLQSNPQLIKSIGWKPEVSFKQLADLMLNEINDFD